MYFQLCCIVFLFMLWQIKFSLSFWRDYINDVVRRIVLFGTQTARNMLRLEATRRWWNRPPKSSHRLGDDLNESGATGRKPRLEHKTRRGPGWPRFTDRLASRPTDRAGRQLVTLVTARPVCPSASSPW